ncbi:hypothetical protein [Actinophytocola algeriensis]|nr:hypothetical protein [Actinophytocola algeriensis]
MHTGSESVHREGAGSQAIRNDLGVHVQWSASRTSVQRLADRQTALGTRLPDGEEKAWVGVPLTVHRRCDQAMFDIVNTVVYDGLMIDGTGTGTGTGTAAGTAFAEAYPTPPPSKWIDVAGADANGRWNPAEGQQLDRILRTHRFRDCAEEVSTNPGQTPFRQLRSLRSVSKAAGGAARSTSAHRHPDPTSPTSPILSTRRRRCMEVVRWAHEPAADGTASGPAVHPPVRPQGPACKGGGVAGT